MLFAAAPGSRTSTEFITHLRGAPAHVAGFIPGCAALARFRNGCGALALDPGGAAWAKTGRERKGAEERALQACRAAGGTQCDLVESLCTEPGGQTQTWSGSEAVRTAGKGAAADGIRIAAGDAAPKEVELTREQRVRMQKGLAASGFDPGPADGMFGPRTHAAIAAWQEAKGLEATGKLSRDQAEALAAAGEEIRKQHARQPEAGQTAHGKNSAVPLEVEMVRFAGGGAFTMGSPEHEEGRNDDERQVQVTFGSAFEMGKYEVTQEQWFAVMDENPSHFSEGKYCRSDYRDVTNRQGDKVGMCPGHPVEQVSWNDAQEFFRRLNQRDGNTGCGDLSRKAGCWRLPTEAEWEYAARAGTEGRYSFGDEYDELGQYAWYGENSRGQTHRVGGKRANPAGLHDVHGNVWEWTMDGYNEELWGGRDPLQLDGKSRVIRGGGWHNFFPVDLRSAYRGYSDGLSNGLGFRMVRLVE